MFTKPKLHFNNRLRTAQTGDDGTSYATSTKAYAHPADPDSLFGVISASADIADLASVRGLEVVMDATGNRYHVTESDVFPGNPKNFGLNGICASSTQFVAVGGADGTDAYIITSPSGLVWTEQENPKNKILLSVVWSGTLFVAVGIADGTDSYIVTSPYGIIWTERAPTVSKNITLTSVCWSGTQFVAVGYADGTDAYILTSPDGITWTEQAPTVAKNVALFSVCWTGAQFVAVGAADGTDAYILTSPDGTTWTERAPTVSKNVALYSVSWSGTQLAAVGQGDGTDSYIVTSPDGITWTEQAPTVAKNIALFSILWSGSKFVAVGVADGSDAYLLTSTDGVTWTERSNPQNIDLNSIIYSGVYYMAVGAADGTDAYIILSDDGETWPDFNRVLTLFERFQDGDVGDSFTIRAPLSCEQTATDRPAFYIADGHRSPRMVGLENTALYLRAHAPNFIEDGGFESGAFGTPWVEGANWTIESVAPLEGAYSATWDLAASNDLQQTVTEKLEKGRSYRLLFKAQSVTANPTSGAIVVQLKQTGSATDIYASITGTSPAITTDATWFEIDFTPDFTTSNWYLKFVGDHTKANGASAVIIDEVYIYEKLTVNSLILGYHNLEGKAVTVNAWRLSPLRSTSAVDANNKTVIGNAVTVTTSAPFLSTLTSTYYPVIEIYIPATASFTPEIGEAYVGDYWQLPNFLKGPLDPYRTNADGLLEQTWQVTNMNPALRKTTVEDLFRKFRDSEAVWSQWDTEAPILMESPRDAREAPYTPYKTEMSIKLVERL